MNDSLRKTWLQYEAGKDYKRRIGLYETVRTNERFYRGDQWHGVPGSDLPKPVFNVVKRVTDYLACSVAPSKISISYIDESATYYADEGARENSKKLTRLLTENARYRWSRAKMDSKLYRLVTDAAISGDGVLYCYWNGKDAGDGTYLGDIETDVIDNADIFVADVNKNDIQSQDYIILSGRASVISLRREARELGVSERYISRIVPDRADDGVGDRFFPELEGDEEAKATYLIKFWREDGFVHFEKSTRECVINRVATPCRLYPIAYFNWSETKNSFHGTSAVSSMIANQKYINRAYAMVMKHMSDTAFSKVIYDKSKIPEWSNEVGEAIGAVGAVNVSDAVTVLGVGKLQDGYLEFLQNVISATKELGGATETALGNITPTNTSAILAIQEASKIPLQLVRSALYRCIEDLASIWADMIIAYFASERLLSLMDESGACYSMPLGSAEGLRVKVRVEAVDTSTYNASITLSILDKLLDGGHITPEQYLKRIPSDYIFNREEIEGGMSDGRNDE